MRLLRLVNGSPLAATSKLMVGDMEIPFYSATISLRVGYQNTITVTAPLEAVDVKFLEEQTKIHIVRDDQLGDPRKRP